MWGCQSIRIMLRSQYMLTADLSLCHGLCSSASPIFMLCQL